MTAACGGGASQIIPGTQEFQNLLASTIVGTLVAGDLDWLASFASGLGYITFDLLNVCATDPPGYPSFSPQRVAGYLNPLNPIGAQQLREDVTQALQTLLWYQYCECVSGPQPTPPTPPGPPAGVQTDNPQTEGVSGPNCGSYAITASGSAFGSNGIATWNNHFNLTVSPATQWVALKFDAAFEDGTTVGFPIVHSLNFVNASAAVLSSQSWTQTAPNAFATQVGYNFPWQVGATNLTLTSYSPTAGTHTLVGECDVQYMCTQPPTSALPSCCPPDPTLENMLVQVMQLEQLILQQLGVTTKYTLSTAHTALTGSGTINVTGLFGVLIQLTAGVPTTPQLPGVPPYQFSVGWISCLTGDGMIDEIRITRQSQVWASRLAPFATQFGYQLNAGFTATITELLPAAA